MWEFRIKSSVRNMVVKDTLIINYMLLISEMRIFLFFNARTIQIVLHMLTLSFIENLFKKNWNMMKMKIFWNLDNSVRYIFLVMSLLWWLRVFLNAKLCQISLHKNKFFCHDYFLWIIFEVLFAMTYEKLIHNLKSKLTWMRGYNVFL